MPENKKKLPRASDETIRFVASTGAFKNGMAPEGIPFFEDPYEAVLHAVTSLAILDDKLVSVNKRAYLDEQEPIRIKPGLRSLPVFLYSAPLVMGEEPGVFEAQSMLASLLVIPDWREVIYYEEVDRERRITSD